ncbi:MAG TPA: fibronectin type III domain-containing protein [Nocardioidaceae bacterium]|nr:fibronectin type III domain-containing protein [Nocardioidaceae bacterium]
MGIVLGSLLVSALSVIAAPALAVDERGTLKLDPNPAIAGEQVRVRAQIPGPARVLYLQRLRGTTWVNVEHKASSRDGSVVFALLAPAQATSYRVYAYPATVNGKKLPAVHTPDRKLKIVAQKGSLTFLSPVNVGVSAKASVAFTPARANRPVELRRKVNGTWQLVAKSTELANGSATFALPTGTAGTFVYRATALKFHGAAAFSTSERTQAVVVPDTTPPAVPTGLAATPGDGTVHVSWDPVAAPDLAGYRVARATALGGPYAMVGPQTTQTAMDVSGTNGTTYWFKVWAIDMTGNNSPLSTAVSATPADLTPPPVPVNLAAEPGNTDVSLTWDAVSATDLAGYRVYRATNAGGPWTLLTVSPILPHDYTVTGLTNETAYWFTVTSVDTHDNESLKSTAVSATPTSVGDTTPPPVPTGLVATTPVTESVHLAWNTVVAGDLDGYHVYLSTSLPTPLTVWTKLTVSPISVAEYDVNALTNGTQYWFSVTSVDTSDNESVKSEPATATPADPGEWRMVSAGNTHTCGVKNVGTLWCWGVGHDGAGEGDPAIPSQVGEASTWASVDASYSFSCALTTANALWCWGNNSQGQLGDGTTTTQPAPYEALPGTWEAVATGTAHTCGVRSDGTLWCWGENSSAQLGDDTTTPRDEPVQVGTGTTWVDVSAGQSHTCATDSDGNGWCWGSNGSGEHGTGDTSTHQTPALVTLGPWSRLATGNQYTCGIKSAGSLWCWGYNAVGQVGGSGGGTTKSQVTAASTWSAVTTGGEHACGIATDKSLFCWGLNLYGQVGGGPDVPAFPAPPTEVAPGSEWRAVGAGTYHSCGVKTDGSAWCWGRNDSGQLGDDTVIDKNVPAEVVG